jgi:cobalt transporter subunit CbtB
MIGHGTNPSPPWYLLRLLPRKQAIADPVEGLARDGSHQVNEGANVAAKEALVQMRIIGSQPETGSQLATHTDTLVAAICAALLGAFVIWGVGFSHIDVLHNAAHDTRHSTGFPCH